MFQVRRAATALNLSLVIQRIVKCDSRLKTMELVREEILEEVLPEARTWLQWLLIDI